MSFGPLPNDPFLKGENRWGTLANRPAANQVPDGTMYFATDNANVYQAQNGAWTAVAGAASAPVQSVFGRTGAVVAASGDYTAAQVNALDLGRLKTARNGPGQSFAANSNSTAYINWPTAFADANYTVSASVVDEASTQYLSVKNIAIKTAAQVAVLINNSDTLNAHLGHVEVIAIHD